MSTTATIEKQLTNFAGLFHFQQGKKSVSIIKEVIMVTTDEKNAANSQKMVELLTKLKNTLPFETQTQESSILKKQLDNTNENLIKINAFLEGIYNLFDGDAEVIIDEPNMQTVINNFKESKDILAYISEYLTLVLEINKAKIEIQSGNFTNFSLDSLSKLLEAA